MKPNFKHTCPNCKYIGTTVGHDIEDWYYCPQLGTPTIVNRYSDDGPGYSSIPVSMLEPALPVYGDTNLTGYSDNNMQALGALTLARTKGLV